MSVNTGRTQNGKSLLLVINEDSPDKVYKFQQKRDDSFVCVGCCQEQRRRRRHNEARISVKTVKRQANGTFSPKFENVIHHCTGFEQTVVQAKVQQAKREVYHSIEKQLFRPLTGYHTITRKIAVIPGFVTNADHTLTKGKELRNLRYHAAKDNPPEIDPFNLLPELKTSHVPNSDTTPISFVLYSSPTAPIFQVFADKYNLEALFNADIIAFDGTFEKVPPGVYQLYAGIAIYHDLPERQSAFESILALLPNKSYATYFQLFSILKAAFESHFGATDKQFHFIVDCEWAVIKALETVFPGCVVTICYFHFNNNLVKNAKRLGGVDMYGDPKFKVFLREIVGTVFMPVDVASQFLDLLFTERHRPSIDNLDDQIDAFISYFRLQWWHHLSRLNHFARQGPRTTNNAEGFNNSLNSKFSESNPSYSKIYRGIRDMLCSGAVTFLASGKGLYKNLRRPENRAADASIQEAVGNFHALSVDGRLTFEQLRTYSRKLSYLGSALSDLDAVPQPA